VRSALQGTGGVFVERVGEPDVALRIDDDVVGDVEALALERVGEDGESAVGLVAHDAAGVFGGSAFASVEAALGVEREAVRAVGVFAPDGDAVRRRVVTHDAAVLDAGKEKPGSVPGGSFAYLAVSGVQSFKLPLFQKRSPGGI